MNPNNPNQPSAVGGAHPYYGNYLTSTVGISLILSILLFLSVGLSNWLTHPDNIEVTLAILGPIFLFAIAFGSHSYYFCISGSYLEIRNHVFPWYCKICRLEDIEIVEFRTGSFRRPDVLRLKRKTGSWSGGFHAGSLRYKNWKALEKALRRRGIPVENRLHGTTS